MYTDANDYEDDGDDDGDGKGNGDGDHLRPSSTRRSSTEPRWLVMKKRRSNPKKTQKPNFRTTMAN